MRAKWESLYRQRDMLTVLVARNFAGPAVVVAAGEEWRVEERVSTALAVR